MPIKIEKIVYPGKALGRTEEGIVAFVHGALPDETVEIDITRRKKKYVEGRVINVITPSKQRIEPTCPSFGKCGGCSLQHADYEDQLKLKEVYVRELLAPLGDIEIQPIIRSPEIWGYRNKMEFSFAEGEKGELFIGLHERGKFDKHFPVPPCFISDEDFLSIVETVQAFTEKSGLPAYNKKTHEGFYRHLVLRKAKRTNQILVNIVTNQDGTIKGSFWQSLVEELQEKITCFYWTINSKMSDTVTADDLIHLSGEDEIMEEMHIADSKYQFAISPFSFFQTNSLGAEVLYETVLDLLRTSKEDILLDLYCGTGTIGITAAPHVKQVLGVELVEDAIENAKQNAKRNNIDNISFRLGSVEKWIKKGDIPSFNSMIIDPPRGGVTPKVLEFIEKTNPKKLIYVSCNPSTLARDLEYLLKEANYHIKTIIPVDMFPQTYHIETVVELTK